MILIEEFWVCIGGNSVETEAFCGEGIGSVEPFVGGVGDDDDGHDLVVLVVDA